MKKALLLFSFLLVFYSTEAQKWRSEYTIGYNWLNPLGEMREKIDRGDGMNMEFFMNTPDKRFALGIELCFANYGYLEFPAAFNNSEQVALKNVRISSQIFNTFLTGRCYLKTEGPFLPYVNLKAGYSDFGTTLHMEDNEGSGHCSGMGDMEYLRWSGTFVMSVGGGVKGDLSYIFKKLPGQSLLLDFSCSYIGGGAVSYLSPNARVVSNDASIETPYDEYIKTDQGTVHINNIGNIYNSMARMLDFRIGIAVRPSGWKRK